MLPPNLARALEKGTVMSFCFCFCFCFLFVFFLVLFCFVLFFITNHHYFGINEHKVFLNGNCIFNEAIFDGFDLRKHDDETEEVSIELN